MISVSSAKTLVLLSGGLSVSSTEDASGLSAKIRSSRETCRVRLTFLTWVMSLGRCLCGQLGDGTTINRSSPVVVDGTLRFSSVGIGYSHGCGVTTSGKLLCWGNNDYGQLGDGTTDSRLTAAKVDGVSTGFIKVISGAYYSCAIKVGGELKCWGSNGFQQLGLQSSVGVPTVVDAGVSYSKVSAGEQSTCGMLTNNTLKCWGLSLVPTSGRPATRYPKYVPKVRQF